MPKSYPPTMYAKHLTRLRQVAILLGCLLAFGLAPCLAAGPNVVFIMADDLGWGDVGFHGGSAPTPHLDRLAAEGLELTQHYVAPVCSPTRSGLMTGRYWSRFGITTPTNDQALPPNTITLPKALKSRGYATCLVGKWHLGSKPEWGPNHYGFDHSYGSLAGGVTAFSHRYKLGPFSVTWHRNQVLLEEPGHVTDLIAQEAVNWIQEHGAQPFFLYVPFTAVHLPINEPEQWLEKVPADSYTNEIGRHYAACVMHLDAAVGEIVAALQRQGLREKTLLVFTSDNGGSTTTNNTQPYPADSSPAGRLTASNGEFRGEKGSVYEGGTRVPTIVSWPGQVPARTESTPVCIVDWMPTICNLVGLNTDQNLHWDGSDLSPLILRKMPLAERPIYIAGPQWRQASLRIGRWKLVSDLESSHQLFDIQSDPTEQHDLAVARAEKVQELLEELRKVRERDKDSVNSPRNSTEQKPQEQEPKE